MERYKQGWLTKAEEKQLVREINLAIIKNDENTHVWNVNFADSDDDEDNDSEGSKKLSAPSFNAILRKR